MTPAQQRAFDAHWARYGLDYAGTPRDLAQAFGRSAPVVLEIGFGNGEQLHAAARDDPARDYLGIEVHGPGVGRLLFEGIFQRVFPLVQGVVVMAGFMVVGINLVVDVLYAFIGPRIRLSR